MHLITAASISVEEYWYSVSSPLTNEKIVKVNEHTDLNKKLTRKISAYTDVKKAIADTSKRLPEQLWHQGIDQGQ